jgi:enoyl-CoA hydratase
MVEDGAASHGRLSEDDGILTVTFDRQDKLNAISPQLTALLWEAVRALGDRDDINVLVITGVGRFFTAGIDLAHPAADRRGGQLPSDIAYRRTYRRHHLLYDEIEAIEKPVILAAQGGCLGAGVELGASCDFRFAAQSAYFGLPEVRLGLIPGSGGASRVTRIVGPHWGKWLAMAGETIDADQALAIGFVHRVFPDESFAEEVHAFARRLASLPVEAVGSAKITVDLAADVDRTSQRHIDRLANTSLALRDDFAERSAAFVRDRQTSDKLSE